ncbi:MAG: lamin tail domain-containing protein [Myxococcota bacterium]
MTLLSILACSDHTYTQLEHEDVFQQERINTVDVLLVVDNSCSMYEEQEKLSTNFPNFIQYFEDAEVDWQIGVVTTDADDPDQSGHLIGGDDEMILVDGEGSPVDQVAYDRDWGVATGIVYSLDPTWESGTSNDSFGHWCTDVAATPGSPNPGCGLAGTGRRSDLGAVIVTEFHPDPDGTDADGEWVEITNISEAEVDLTGWTIIDAGTNECAFPDGTVLAADAQLVIARSSAVAEADVLCETGLTLNNGDLWLTSETEGADEIFVEMVTQGISGTGFEMGLEAARLALVDDPDVEGDAAESNVGFVREEANLAILVVSDEEDSSPMSVDSYLRAFADVKGDEAYRDHRVMSVSAVIGSDPPEFDGQASCESEHGAATYGERYVDAVAQTGGLMDSICAADFSPIVAELGLTLSGLASEFVLSRVPELETLAVSLYADASDESKIGDLTRDVDYMYVEETNSIVFDATLGHEVPDSEQYILVEYEIRSGG